MSRIELGGVSVDGPTVRCSFDATGTVRRFFASDRFAVAYDVDVSDVPEHVLTIPWLANVCPVAWAAGADVIVPRLDARFARSLDRVQRVFRGMYPEFMEGGAVLADVVVEDDAPRPEAGGDGLLFSGGIDSLTSYYRHADREPGLITVHGTDIFLDQREAWTRTREQVETFADERGLETYFVRSNMRHFLDRTLLLAHYKRYIDHLWYSSVQQGLGLTGLCAPLAYATGMETLYIAASKWIGRLWEPWGSHPDIDSNVAWSGTDVRHDGYEMTRQEKIEFLAERVRGADLDLQVRTCFWDERGGNCNRCEKCARTIVGLTLAGLDPNDHGYVAGPATFEHVREQFETGGWAIEENHLEQWLDLQEHVDPDREYPVAGAAEFFDWFAGSDVHAWIEHSSRPLVHRAVHALARNTPYPVYAALYPTYRSRVRGQVETIVDAPN